MNLENFEEDLPAQAGDLGEGGSRSRRLRKLGFSPQITLQRMPHITQSWRKMDESQLRDFIESYGLKTVPRPCLQG